MGKMSLWKQVVSSSGSWEECGECLGESTPPLLTNTLGHVLGSSDGRGGQRRFVCVWGLGCQAGGLLRTQGTEPL